ncbi:response regulator [Halovenus sp. WSH3]|uniref:Response regulator n=1 Tax=Halovenus carboxidivorans TaxID=2692199 RepID=A0A6B0T602_9EURY|nr:hybrid sensor histidine kinase/response regulator [Halovenus carboxidivorans]MXR50641.1 response regulator [Halovenus carboxidivorans]
MTAGDEPLAVLLVEDNPGDAKLVEHHLRDGSTHPLGEEVAVTHVESLTEAETALESGSYELVFLDLGLPETTGIETLERVDETVETTAIIVLTGLDDSETAIEAIQQGAQDYLPKGDLDAETLWRSLRYAVERERQEQELRRRTEQLGFFSSILRHDVNNGIEVIKRNAHLLEPELDGEQRERAETIIDWSENITDLTEKIQVMIEGITHGEQQDLEAVDLSTVVEGQVETVEQMGEDVRIETSIPFGLSVRANEMLPEVFHNLLTNAVEHNDTDQPRITVDAEQSGETVTVSIADNGPGIPDDERGELFSWQGGGTGDSGGFGLYFVQTMIESYGGSITAAANEPRGTEFTIRLPAA